LTAKPFGLSFLSQLKDRFFNGFFWSGANSAIEGGLRCPERELLWLEEAGTNEGSA
jgi:hypothetical protein